MANKREFKKYVAAVGSSACNDMMQALYEVDNINKEQVSNAIEKILDAVATARANSNVFFDKGVKAFADRVSYNKEKKEFFVKLFNKINDDFAKELDEAIKIFNSAIPQKVKDSNKELASEN